MDGQTIYRCPAVGCNPDTDHDPMPDSITALAEPATIIDCTHCGQPRALTAWCHSEQCAQRVAEAQADEHDRMSRPVVPSSAHDDHPVTLDLARYLGKVDAARWVAGTDSLRCASIASDYVADVPVLVTEVRRLQQREADLTRSLDVEIAATARKVADDAAEYARDVTTLAEERDAATAQLDTVVEALSAVHRLHQPDPVGYCKSCRTDEFPCKTARAIGADQ
jgi:hypothetical protein